MIKHIASMFSTLLAWLKNLQSSYSAKLSVNGLFFIESSQKNVVQQARKHR